MTAAGPPDAPPSPPEASADASDDHDALKRELAIGALLAGCPGAFVDFYYLTTAGDGVGDDVPTEEELLARLVDPDAFFEEKEEVPLEHMPFVRDALVAAETNLRHPPETGDDADATVSPSAASGGDPAASAQAAFASLARFFRDTDNPQKAIYFYDKCLAAAVETRRAEHEADACRSLAEVHESVKNWPSAVACRERETRVAEALLKKSSAKDADAPSASASAARVAEARLRLVNAYYAAAAWRRSEGDASGQVAFLERCLKTCARGGGALDGDASSSEASASSPSSRAALASEGAARHALGLACLSAGDAPRAVELQTGYLDACAALGDREGRRAALRARAEAKLRLADDDGAARDLEEAANADAGEDDPPLAAPPPEAAEGWVAAEARARACCSLGKIHLRRGQAEASVARFRTAFALARANEAAAAAESAEAAARMRALAETARVNVGAALGAARREAFLREVGEVGKAGTASDKLARWDVEKDPRAMFEEETS